MPLEPRPDRRRARTRAALLQAGEALFSAHAIDAVSIDDIVAAADVAKGSFYNHFPDKEALARTIAEAVRAELEAEIDHANQGLADPLQRMARAQAVVLRFTARDPQRARAMNRLFAGATLPQAPLNRGVRQDIEAGLAAGVFNGLTVEAGVLLAMGVAAIAAARLLDPANPTPLPQLSRQMNLGLLRGLGVADAAARQAAEAAAAAILEETQ
jgi:AcrR family transcriptional regulator